MMMLRPFLSLQSSGRVLQFAIIGIGALVFALLLFADKTNLTNLEAAEIKTDTRGILPPLAPDEKLESMLESLNSSAESDKIRILDSIVISLQTRGRYAYASDYAEQQYLLDRSLENLYRVGDLSRRAAQLDFVQKDTSLFGKYSRRGLQRLQELTTQQPDSEAGLLSYGLALVQSRQQQNSMQGILTIRKVVEMNPQNAEAAYHLGVFSVQTGQFDKAEKRFEDVLSVDPAFHDASLQLAFVKIQLRKSEEAQAILDKLVNDNDVDPETRLKARDLMKQI